MTINQLEKAQHLQNEFNVTLDILNKECLELKKHCYSTAPLGKPRSRYKCPMCGHAFTIIDSLRAATTKCPSCEIEFYWDRT